MSERKPVSSADELPDRPAQGRNALMRQMTLAQREVRSWPAWMTARATMPKWMLEWDE